MTIYFLNQKMPRDLAALGIFINSHVDPSHHQFETLTLWFKLFNDNSDPWIVKAFSKELHDEYFCAEKINSMDWQDLMNEVLCRLVTEHNLTVEDLRAQVRKLLTDSERETIKALFTSLKEYGFDINILSDANHFFIGEALGPELRSMVTLIATNPFFENELTKGPLRPFATSLACQQLAMCLTPDGKPLAAHTSPNCPKNMCKRQVLNKWREMFGNLRVFYFGDGTNDVCPSMTLQKGDITNAREGYEMARMLTANPPPKGATVRIWKTLEHVREYLQKDLDALPPLDKSVV
jgi:hypothetical protein